MTFSVWRHNVYACHGTSVIIYSMRNEHVAIKIDTRREVAAWHSETDNYIYYEK